MLKDAAAFLKEHDDYLLIAHLSPDGDTLGSSLALHAGLLALGKKAQAICQDPVPEQYRFFPGSENILSPETVEPRENVVCIDCADAARTGRAEPLFQGAKHTLCIDHHGTNPLYAQVNYVERRAAAGELVYLLLRELNVPISADMAACLYGALVSDTGNFAYSNTTKETFAIAGELVGLGADVAKTNQRLYRTVPLCRLKLHARGVEKVRLSPDGQVAVTSLSSEDFLAVGAERPHSEGLVETLRDIETVEISALLKEMENGEVRVSLRAKNRGNVAAIAGAYDGGGHRMAAGCTLHMPLAEAEEAIYRAAVKALREN